MTGYELKADAMYDLLNTEKDSFERFMLTLEVDLINERIKIWERKNGKDSESNS